MSEYLALTARAFFTLTVVVALCLADIQHVSASWDFVGAGEPAPVPEAWLREATQSARRQLRSVGTEGNSRRLAIVYLVTDLQRVGKLQARTLLSYDALYRNPWRSLRRLCSGSYSCR